MSNLPEIKRSPGLITGPSSFCKTRLSSAGMKIRGYTPFEWPLKVRMQALSSLPSSNSDVSNSQALMVLSYEEEKIKSPVQSILTKKKMVMVYP